MQNTQSSGISNDEIIASFISDLDFALLRIAPHFHITQEGKKAYEYPILDVFEGTHKFSRTLLRRAFDLPSIIDQKIVNPRDIPHWLSFYRIRFEKPIIRLQCIKELRENGEYEKFINQASLLDGRDSPSDIFYHSESIYDDCSMSIRYIADYFNELKRISEAPLFPKNLDIPLDSPNLQIGAGSTKSSLKLISSTKNQSLFSEIEEGGNLIDIKSEVAKGLAPLLKKYFPLEKDSRYIEKALEGERLDRKLTFVAKTKNKLTHVFHSLNKANLSPISSVTLDETACFICSTFQYQKNLGSEITEFDFGSTLRDLSGVVPRMQNPIQEIEDFIKTFITTQK